jgi:hypothetical protein
MSCGVIGEQGDGERISGVNTHQVNLINVYMSEMPRKNSLPLSIYTFKNEGQENKLGPVQRGVPVGRDRA